MRVALPIVAALALAACQVDVEGAPCATPGARTDCPDGQACGNDLKCSTRAAGCKAAQAFCTPGATPAASPKRCRGDAAAIQTCTNADEVCGAWAVVSAQDDCASGSLECREPSAGQPACLCRIPTDAIRVDAAAAPGLLARTGADQPSQCRFAKLGDALAYAKDVWMPAHGDAPATVRAVGAPAPGTPVVFGAESFPLVIPSGVTLSTAASPTPADWVISANPDASVDVIQLHDGATIEGFTVRSVSARGDGIAAATCGSTTPPAIRSVIVEGGAQVARGVSVSGACGALLERVDVSGATGAALEIATPASAPVTARGSRFHGSDDVGIRATGGILSFEPSGMTQTEVTDNVGNGVVLGNGVGGGSAKIEATLAGVLVARNGGAGLFVNSVPATSKLTMTSCDVHSNATSAPIMYGPAGNRRSAGGVLLTQASLAAFDLRGNRIYANHGGTGADELAFESTGPWTLSSGVCTTSNAFGCVGAGAAVGVISGGTVYAQFTTWPVIPPALSGDVRWSPDYCEVTLAPACPP